LQRKLLAIIVVIIIVVAAVAAIELTPKTPSTPSADARDIKIGLVAPLSTTIGQDMSDAAQLAAKEINDAGGIYVKDWNTNVNVSIVNVNTIDDAPANAKTPVVQAVESEHVDMLIGGYGSAGTLANEVVAIDDKVPYIITGASNQLVTRRGPQGNYGGFGVNGANSITDAEGMSYIFHYCTTTYHYSKTVVDFFATEMKPTVAPNRNFSLAILYRNDAFGQGVDQATKYWIQNESLPITLTERSYDPATPSYQTDLTVIKQANPDAVFVVDNPDKTPLIIKQGWNDVGLKSVYIAVENNQDPTFYNLLGSTGDGQLLESKLDPFMTPSYSQIVQNYVQNFNRTYPHIMPGMMGADTYDAFYIAKDAITRAGTVDKATVRQAIETTNLNQLLIQTKTGKIQFSTGINYHEIDPVTFIEQLQWNTTNSHLTSQIVWSPPGSTNLKQTDFVLPSGYQPGQ
jgi:branched-chain amino acid transport system substrate-binding protein